MVRILHVACCYHCLWNMMSQHLLQPYIRTVYLHLNSSKSRDLSRNATHDITPPPYYLNERQSSALHRYSASVSGRPMSLGGQLSTPCRSTALAILPASLLPQPRSTAMGHSTNDAMRDAFAQVLSSRVVEVQTLLPILMIHHLPCLKCTNAVVGGAIVATKYTSICVLMNLVRLSCFDAEFFNQVSCKPPHRPHVSKSEFASGRHQGALLIVASSVDQKILY